MKDIIVIVGPTGVGKTKLSVELAKLIDAEIINADSMQIYKELNIGTAKIREEEKEGIPHYLFDIKNVEEQYTIYDYQKDCRMMIDDILKRGKKVIIVGGSGLYIRSALYDYNLQDEQVYNDYNGLSNEELMNKVLEIDSNSQIHVNNRKRLVRFLNKVDNNDEIQKESKPIYNFCMIGLTTERENLYNIINKRVDKMISCGLIDEVKKFYDRNIYSKSIMTGIGYKELYQYFSGEITLEEAIEFIKRNSRRYAKRQYTFFNNQFVVEWFNTNYDNFNETVDLVYQYLKEE